MDDLDRQLRDLGCPYEASDYRARLWLEGYKAGFNAGHDGAAKVAMDAIEGIGK
jgi:hypothetical protein